MISPASPAVVILFGILGFVAVVLFYGVRRPEERRALFAIAVGAYLLKVVLVPLYYWVLVAGGHDGFAYFDAVGYHESAVEMAFEFTHGLAFNSVGWTYKDPGYNVIIAGLYSIFGASTLIARIFNVVIGVFTILYVYRIGCLAFDEQVGKTAAKFAAFLPFTILVTINHRKEAVAIFLATLIFYHALRVVTQQPRWMNSIPVLILFLIPMYFVRGSFVLPFIGLFLVMLFLTQRSLLVGIMLSVLVMVGVIGVQLLDLQGGELDVQANIQAMDRMTGKAARNVAQSEGMLRYVKITSITENLEGAVRRVPAGPDAVSAPHHRQPGAGGLRLPVRLGAHGLLDLPCPSSFWGCARSSGPASGSGGCRSSSIRAVSCSLSAG